MTPAFIDRIDPQGVPLPFPAERLEAVLTEGETLHCAFRPVMAGRYVEYLTHMAAEGAGLLQLVDEGQVRAIAVWRSFLTTYCGRRFEIDDLVTDETHRSRGYGGTMLRALEAKARDLDCDTVMLASATWRVEAHRFYFRERYSVGAFLFDKKLG